MSKFVPRLTAPKESDPYYRTTAAGGYNPGINRGSGSVLPNCIAYAAGRVLELFNKGAQPDIIKSCNAEDTIYLWKYARLSKEPVLGSVMCWVQGANFNGSDGYGHVAVVEEIKSPNEVVVSESNYYGSKFYTKTRTKGYGNWGSGSSYTFVGFMVFDYEFEEDKEPEVPETPTIPEIPIVPDTQMKSIEEVAREVIHGNWGNGSERVYRLTIAGYDSAIVQAKVNAILYGEQQPAKPEQPKKPEKSVEEVAREVIRGEWGNGKQRFERLDAAGYDSDFVQKTVNKLLRIK